MRIATITLLVIAVCIPLSAQTVSVVETAVPYLGSVYYCHQRNVARTSTGTLIAAWASGSGAGSQVQFSMYDKDFQTWSPASAISNAPAAGLAIQPAMASDEQGNIHATWQQRATSSAKYQIYYSKFDGVSWSTPKQISVAASVRGEEATIEVDSKGYLWVVYNNDGEGVGKEWVYMVKSTDGGTTWSSTADTLSTGGTLGTSIEVGRSALAAGPNGRLVAIWDNSLEGTGARREVYVNQFDGSAWSGPVRISDTTAVDRDHNRYVAVAVDGQSNIYAFYTLPIVSGADPRLSRIVLHKKAWADSWTQDYTLALDSSEVNFFTGGAVADSQGVIHFAYRRDVASDTTGLNEIVYQYTKNGGATWSSPLVLSRSEHDANYASIGNRVRTAYGVDVAWKEGRDIKVTDQDTNSVMVGVIPYSVVTAVPQSAVPHTYETLSNYPNPFNPSTTISFDVAVRGLVRLTVYDLLGREVVTLSDEVREAGRHATEWNGTNAVGQPVTSGVYLARLTTASGSRSLNMLLVK